jgi:cardiolipin synthase
MVPLMAAAPLPSLAAERAPYAEARVGPNRVALLRDGEQAYPAMLAAIAGAKSTICLETYKIGRAHV